MANVNKGNALHHKDVKIAVHFTYAQKGVMIVLSTISSTLSDGLDPSELLYLRLGGGRVTGDRLPRFAGLVTGSAGTDSGLLSRVAEVATLVLLVVCVL